MEKKYYFLTIVVRIFFLFFVAFNIPVYAASLSPVGPSGGMTSSAPNGADDFLSGVQPPPGFYLLNYTFYYSAKRYNNTDGDKVHTGIFSDFEADIYGNIARFIWIPERDIRIFGGKWAPDIGIPLVHKRIKTTAFDDSKSGLGDIVFAPVNLFYRWGNYHTIWYVDIIAPTGRYDKHDLVNIGNNHWSFKPSLIVTYWDEPWETTGIFHFDVHTQNNDYIDPRNGWETSYKTGEAFHLDYTVSRTIFPGLRAGLTGYYWRDVARDEVNGESVPDTQTEVFSMGPGLKWDYKGISLIFKINFEVYAENRPQGQYCWLRLIYRF